METTDAATRPERLTSAAMDTTYLVECFWPGVTREVITAASGTRARMRACVTPRRVCAGFVGSMLVPADEVVFFQFTAVSEDDVIRAAREANLAVRPRVRIAVARTGSEASAGAPSRRSMGHHAS